MRIPETKVNFSKLTSPLNTQFEHVFDAKLDYTIR